MSLLKFISKYVILKCLILQYSIIYLLVISVVCGGLTTAIADGMSTAFEQRDKYKSETRLGNPDVAKKFIDRSGDTSKLQRLNDTSLVSEGIDSLRDSEFGQFLQDSEEAKIEAMNRYKINSENAMLKNSLKIEEDPMSKTGGSSLGSTVKTTKIKIKKSCTEGVDFNVDVGLELVLEVEEEEYLGPLQTESRLVDVGGDAVYNGARHLGYPIFWKKKRNGWHIYQQSYGWRIYLSNFMGIPLENIDETISFPGGNRGIGATHYAGGDHIIVFNAYRFGYTYKFQEKLKRLVEKDEYWRISTEGAEKLAESNECYETGRVCIKKGVRTFLGKYEVTRPCWYEKISYRCKSEPKDGCAHLIKQDCQLQESECEYKVGPICLRWKRDYLCGGQKKELKFSLADSPIYCLGGDCHTPSMEENQDFANVAYLAALNEANKDCVKEASGLCKNPITIFPGIADGCKKIIVGFIDCCSSMKGWANNVNLCKCSGGEKGLSLKREKGLCHRVGTYCHKKDPVFNTCLVKKTNFCCFGSKLARVFQEQGRKQLGISWGSEKSPDCRPLTLDEFTRIDFSKIDLEELMDALLSKGKKNANKSFPTLTPGEIPDIQKEHMKTTAEEKRDIRRRAEEEAERLRLAKLEAERLEKERLARIERERLERIEKARLAEIVRKKEAERLKILAEKRSVISTKITAKYRELQNSSAQLNSLNQEMDAKHRSYMQHHNATHYFNIWQEAKARREKCYMENYYLKQRLQSLRTELSRLR